MIVAPLSQEDTSDIWRKVSYLRGSLSEASFFLTGGTGFFGKWLLESLIYIKTFEAINFKITVLSRNPENFLRLHPHIASQKWIYWIKGEINSFEYPNEEINYIIHAAADTNRTGDPALSRIQLLDVINGTNHIVGLAQHSNCNNILFTSSGAVYSSNAIQRGMIHESEKSEISIPSSGITYGLSKLVSEHQLSLFAEESGCNITIARCFAFIGPGLSMNGNYAIGNFLRDGMSGRTIKLHSDGNVIRSYLYASDLTIWLLTMLFKAKGFQLYNVGSSTPITILELAKKIADKYNVKIETSPNYQEKSLQSAYYPDVTRARSELGLSETIGIDQAIEKTVKWHKR